MEEEGVIGELKLPNEKREYPRIPMTVSVRYRVLGSDEADKNLTRFFDADKILQEYYEGETVNVSKTGILMYTNEEIPVKSFVAVNMYLSVPGISCNCKALAQVIRREKNEDTGRYTYTVALKFLKILHHNLKSYKFLNLNDLLDVKEKKE